jgi:hypothetical protein
MIRKSGFAVLLIVLMLQTSRAQIPLTMSYQGVLTDISGSPVADGNVTLTFRLYDGPTGGTSLWQETQQVAVSKGIFSVLLGSTIPLNLPFDRPYWLSIMVSQGAELTPRIPLSASPYSMNSRIAMAEPGNGQGITIRDLSGNTTHVLHQDGDSYHKGKTRLGSRLQLAMSAPDTALVIGDSLSPALLFVFRPAGTGSGGQLKTKAGGQYHTDHAVSVQEELVGGDLRVFGGDVVVVDGASQNPVTTMGLDGVSTEGTVDANGILSRGALAVLGLAGDTVVVFRPDGTSYHKGLEVYEAGISITGTGRGIRFPDGTYQGTAGMPGTPFDGVLVGKALVVKSASGVEVFRVDTTGASLHKGDETFEGDVILKGTGGKGAKWVDANGLTLAGFGRVDLTTGQKIGVYGRAATAGDLAGAFEGDVEVNGEVYVSSLHVIGVEGDTVVHFNSDGTSTHKGLETYQAGLQTVLNNGNFLKVDPSAGLTLKTPQGQFRGHMDPNGNGLFAGNLGVAGNLTVAGTLQKGSGSFKIDHPLDPENKYLYHSFVESPDMMNIYNGNVTLDEQGEAEVSLPEWFEALNRDFRYQLTAIGKFAPVYVAQEIKENRFMIAGGTRGQKISWQVTGIRKDAFAEHHRIPVEETKSLTERGKYLHPEDFGKPLSNGIINNSHQQVMRTP